MDGTRTWNLLLVHFLTCIPSVPIHFYSFYSLFQTMRKIEQQMNKAILNREDFKKDNTEVITISDCSFVYLHGNHIATVGKTLDICDAGWQTVTTKSRLNALLNEFAEGCYVFQKNFDWFLGDADGNVLPFPTEEFVTV